VYFELLVAQITLVVIDCDGECRVVKLPAGGVERERRCLPTAPDGGGHVLGDAVLLSIYHSNDSQASFTDKECL